MGARDPARALRELAIACSAPSRHAGTKPE
jgi:hypothetical protein